MSSSKAIRRETETIVLADYLLASGIRHVEAPIYRKIRSTPMVTNQRRLRPQELQTRLYVWNGPASAKDTRSQGGRLITRAFTSDSVHPFTFHVKQVERFT